MPNSFQIIEGDALEVLRTLPAESVQCCVTSPPYWGLRDYGVEGQLGLEPTPELYVERMVEVFREVRRVLRGDGTVWLNLGSSYMASPRGNKPGEHSTSRLTNPARQDAVSRGNGPIRFRRGLRAPAYGTDGTEPQDSTASDCACSGLCDGCLAD